MGNKYRTTKYKLAKKYAEKMGITIPEAERSVKCMFEAIYETAKECGYLTISGFGTFLYKRKEPSKSKTLFGRDKIKPKAFITFKTNVKEYFSDNSNNRKIKEGED